MNHYIMGAIRGDQIVGLYRSDCFSIYATLEEGPSGFLVLNDKIMTRSIDVDGTIVAIDYNPNGPTLVDGTLVEIPESYVHDLPGDESMTEKERIEAVITSLILDGHHIEILDD